MEILDLGCGPHSKKEGSVGVDITAAPHVDLVHDLNRIPYPFENDRFDYIEMSHIIEHLQQPAQAMEEVHRIAKPGATIRIITPHYASQLSYGDLTHFHHFGYVTFTTLCNSGKFKIDKKKLWFTDFYKVLGLAALANLFPRRWEKYLAFMVPALYVEVFLRVIK